MAACEECYGIYEYTISPTLPCLICPNGRVRWWLYVALTKSELNSTNIITSIQFSVESKCKPHWLRAWWRGWWWWWRWRWQQFGQCDHCRHHQCKCLCMCALHRKDREKEQQEQGLCPTPETVWILKSLQDHTLIYKTLKVIIPRAFWFFFSFVCFTSCWEEEEVSLCWPLPG